MKKLENCIWKKIKGKGSGKIRSVDGSSGGQENWWFNQLCNL